MHTDSTNICVSNANIVLMKLTEIIDRDRGTIDRNSWNRGIMMAPKGFIQVKFCVLVRLTGEDETSDLGILTLDTVVTRVGLNITSELDTDQGEGIRDQLTSITKQLYDRTILNIYNFNKMSMMTYPLTEP